MKRSVVAAALGALLLVTGCTQQPIVVIPSVTAAVGNAPLRVGTAMLPDGATPQEGTLLANIYAQALNAAGAKAIVVPSDATDPTSLKKLQNGTVDIVPGYSTQFLAAAGRVDAAGTEDVIAALKSTVSAPVEVLNASSAVDDDGIAVTAATAQKYQLKTIPDLAKVCDTLVFGGTAEFKTKSRGLSGLASDYNCVPKSYVVKTNQNNALVQALLNDSVQVADIHSSSPAIEDNALIVLEDTKNLFPDEKVVPLVNNKRVTGDIRDVINKVSAALTTEELINLNRFAAVNNFATPEAAAHAWLVQIGLVKANS